MAYSPSPRPTFDGPAHIPYSQVTRHLWGEPDAGEVSDWIYASTDKIHQLLFGLAPGGSFRHSDSFRTVFAADEVLTVVEGNMVIANPETGEVHLVKTGESVFFRRDTWHHAFNDGPGPLRVLEYFAPPPSQGTSGSYARTRPLLERARYEQAEHMQSIPMQNEAIRAQHTMKVLRDSDLIWRMEGDPCDGPPMLIGLLAATEHLTVGRGRLRPGQKSPLQRHAGDESLYLLSGTLNVFVPEAEGQRWFELSPKDGFYLPAGTPHQYHNVTGEPVEFIFGVAPDYGAPEDTAPGDS